MPPIYLSFGIRPYLNPQTKRRFLLHDPTLNPTRDKNLAGKHRRYAEHGLASRRFASDSRTEHAIMTLKSWLAGRVESGDVVSVSLLARRAIRVYLEHCRALYGVDNLAGERDEIRKGSRMPSAHPRKRKKVPYVSKRKREKAQPVVGC